MVLKHIVVIPVLVPRPPLYFFSIEVVWVREQSFHIAKGSPAKGKSVKAKVKKTNYKSLLTTVTVMVIVTAI